MVVKTMTLEEIKAAVRAGKTVHWASEGYRVIWDKRALKWLIVCDKNQNTIALTWSDGTTLNGYGEEFFVKK